MKSTDHVDFGDPLPKRFANDPNDFFDREFESMRVPLARGKGAKLAREHANIRVVDVAVVNESRVIAVLLLSHSTRQDSEGVQVVRPVEIERFRLGNALSGV